MARFIVAIMLLCTFLVGITVVYAGPIGTTNIVAQAKKDGAACSDSSECIGGSCEGGSCYTSSGNACDSNSHCSGHMNCTNGKCP